MTTGTYLDQLSNPKNPYFDTFDKSVALMVQKLVCSIFGLDFPLGVQTLGLACSLMMMMESNYAVHVL